MLLTYVDESYDRDFYWIAALMVAEQDIRPLSQALDSVVEKASKSYPVARDAELHGHAIVQAKDDWAGMDNSDGNLIRARIGVYGDALRAIAGYDVRVIVRGLDIQKQKARYVKPYPPHDVVLSQLLERIDAQAKLCGQLALVIADEIDSAEDHRKSFRDYQQVGTGGYLSSTLPRLVDTIHFAPSVASRCLQAVDLIAYLHRRLHSGQDRSPKAKKANEKLWSYIEPKVVHNHCWEP
ncbi:DUF3800 domain-containing protein [Streptomyces sp. NPDC059374]|uniref:DUF3800 domain-containing protein n=1 Tax=Streptomyces sp. NPDC059374 TaxID=3346814 RepID=UPI0036898F68